MESVDSPTLGELVRSRPARAIVLDRFRLDYCCGGNRPLDEACAASGVDQVAVRAALEEFDATPEASSEQDLLEIPLGELLDHILFTHHVYLKEELPRLTALATKVARRHGENHPNLVKLDQVVQALAAELTLHLRKEEEVLFPMIRAMSEPSAESSTMGCGSSVAGPISVMEAEHDGAGDALRRIRKLANDFVPPEEACNSWRALYAGLEGLEADTHRHIHKENCALHPRALALVNG